MTETVGALVFSSVLGDNRALFAELLLELSELTHGRWFASDTK